ncbi:MAG: uracil-DNA glycosylase family protein, partial [Spirochaetota bacterium]
FKMNSSVEMFRSISSCSSCNIRKNQDPLYMTLRKADVFWIGLSAVKCQSSDDRVPLSETTKSGNLINRIEKEAPTHSFYRTNLVKCLPLTEEEKIRYPNGMEKKNCISHIRQEIQLLQPKLVFLLGKMVATFVLKDMMDITSYSLEEDFAYSIFENRKGIKFIPIHHPSYILIYKRKKEDLYQKEILKIITQTSVSLTANKV